MSCKLSMTISVLFVIFNISVALRAQELSQFNVSIPTSPQAEAIGRYGEFASINAQGVPDISIPLYEINHRGYKLPIYLRYDPTPLKPGYNYDVFGLGWGFSINSCISRSIEYKPDEAAGFNLETEWLDDIYSDPTRVICSNCLNYNYAHDKFHAVLPNGTSFDFIIDNVGGKNVYTVSGDIKFKIGCFSSSSNIASFFIIDDAGVKYTFEGSDTPYQGYWSNYNSYFVSWSLTRIDLPFSNEPIIFSYDYTIQSPYIQTCSEPGISILDVKKALVEGPTTTWLHEVNAENSPSYPPYVYKMKLLSAISYGHTNIQLVYQDQNAVTVHNCVDKINIVEFNSLKKEIDLGMTFKSLSGYCSSNQQIAKLGQVIIKGSGTTENPIKYQFTYGTADYHFTGTDHWGYLNSHDVEYNVANFNLFVEFDTNTYPEVFSYSSISPVTKSAEDLCPYSKIKLSKSNFDNRQPAYPEECGLLKTIIYPTGGFSEFEFENHKFLTSTDSQGNFIYDPVKKVEARAAGFRIKKITNYSAEGLVTETKNYSYGKRYGDGYNPGNGIDYNAEHYPNIHVGLGEAVVDPNVLTYMAYSYYIPGKNASYPFCYPEIRNMFLGLSENGERNSFQNPFVFDRSFFAFEWKWKAQFNASNFRSVLGGRPPVAYPEISVYYGDIGNDGDKTYTPEKTNGKTVYKYDIMVEDYTGDKVLYEKNRYFGNTMSYEPKGARYNNLKEKCDYRYDGHDFQLVRKEEKFWLVSSSAYTDYINTNPFPDPLDGQWPIVGLYFEGRPSYLERYRLESNTITSYYTNGQSTISGESYGYNDRDQVASISSAASDGRLTTTTFVYPIINSGGTTDPIVQKMVDRNMISTVLEKKTTLGTAETGNKIVFDEFQSGNSTIIMPAEFFELEDKPSGPEYVLNGQILEYTSNGNPKESVDKDGIHSCYQWDSNDMYMTAWAKNAESDEIACTSFEPNTSGVWNFTGLTISTSCKRTGNYGLSLEPGKILTSPVLSTAGDYFVEFYAKNDYGTVPLGINGISQNLNPNYNFYRVKCTVPANGVVTFTPLQSYGPVRIDEIRIYPIDAQITTFNYNLGIGMCSKTDPTGVTTYYEYDNFSRLKFVKDDDGNILNHSEIHYAE